MVIGIGIGGVIVVGEINVVDGGRRGSRFGDLEI